MGLNPASATQSGVVQRQDAALLRQLSGFESLRRSRGRLAQLVVRQPVKLEGTGSNPVVAAMPASPCNAGNSSSHGETEIMPAYEVGGGGSSPPGSAQARLAQWQSTASTPRRKGFDSLAEYCGRFRSGRGARSWSWCERVRVPPVTPRAGCSWVRQAVCKAAASAVGVRISPRPPCFHGPADRTPVSETGSRRFESSWKRMARDSLVREAVRKTAAGRFDSGPCLFGAHAVDGRGRLDGVHVHGSGVWGNRY